MTIKVRENEENLSIPFNDPPSVIRFVLNHHKDSLFSLSLEILAIRTIQTIKIWCIRESEFWVQIWFSCL